MSLLRVFGGEAWGGSRVPDGAHQYNGTLLLFTTDPGVPDGAHQYDGGTLLLFTTDPEL